MFKLTKIFGISMRTAKYLLIFALFGLSLLTSITSIDMFIEYSSLPVGVTKAFLGILALNIIDDVVFNKINTIEEIKNKNIGYAIIYLANAIIIASCIAAA